MNDSLNASTETACKESLWSKASDEWKMKYLDLEAMKTESDILLSEICGFVEARKAIEENIENRIHELAARMEKIRSISAELIRYVEEQKRQ